MKKKTILYMSANIGSGHKMAVRSLMESIETYYPGKYEQKTFDDEDLEKDINSLIFRGFGNIYTAMIKRAPVTWKAFFEVSDKVDLYEALNKAWSPVLKKDFEILLERYKPDLIITTFPFIDRALKKALKVMGLNIPVVVMVTDSGDVHRIWISEKVDHYLTISKNTADFLVKSGIKESKVNFLGCPARQDFYKKYSKEMERKRLGLNPSKKTILFWAGGLGLGKIYRKTVVIDENLRNAQVIVLCGRNEKLKEKIEKTRFKNNVLPLYYREDIPRILAATDLVITKSGGISVMELITFKKPMVVTEIIPGHEEPNAKFVKKMGFGYVCKRPKQLGDKIREIFDNGLIHEMEKNLADYQHNEKADFRVAKFIDGVVEEAEDHAKIA